MNIVLRKRKFVFRKIGVCFSLFSEEEAISLLLQAMIVASEKDTTIE